MHAGSLKGAYLKCIYLKEITVKRLEQNSSEMVISSIIQQWMRCCTRPHDIIWPIMENKQELEQELEEELEEVDVIEDDDLLTFTIGRGQFLAILVPVAFVVGLAVGYLAWGRQLSAATQQLAAVQEQVAGAQQQAAAQQQPSSQQQAAVPAGEYQRYDIPIDDNDPVLGAADAPVTIIEYSDFECPYCQRHALEVHTRLVEEYGDQVRFIYKDFPLTSIHANAVPAAVAALCANEQGEFWAFHDLLFSMQLGLNSDAYSTYAETLSLDESAFAECVAEGRYEGEVNADLEWAAQLGVQSTPTFFINGIPMIGAQSFEAFQQVIEAELANQ